jgi:predicted nucleic acid-binding protein
VTRLFFADTFYFIALLNSRDPAHAKAIYFSRMTPVQFVTTEYVLLELADAFHKGSSRAEFLTIWELLRREAAFRIISGDSTILGRGVQLYKKRLDKEWQLTDCISFVVMKDLAIDDALTGDKHFEQAGFNALLK